MAAVPPSGVRAAGLALLSQMKDKQNNSPYGSPPGSPRAVSNGTLTPTPFSSNSTNQTLPRFVSPPPPGTSSPRSGQGPTPSTTPSPFQLPKRGSGIVSSGPTLTPKWTPPSASSMNNNTSTSNPTSLGSYSTSSGNSSPALSPTPSPSPFGRQVTVAPQQNLSKFNSNANSATAPTRTLPSPVSTTNKGSNQLTSPNTMFGSKAPPPISSTKFPPYDDSTVASNSSSSSAYSNASDYSTNGAGNGGVYNAASPRKGRNASIGSTISTASSSSISTGGAAVVNLTSNSTAFVNGGGINRSSQNMDSSVPISEYRPRVTIFERQEFKQNAKQGETCGVEDCWQPAEINGLCIKHYYSYPHEDHSNGMGNLGPGVNGAYGAYGGSGGSGGSAVAVGASKKVPPSIPVGFLGVNRPNPSNTTSSSSAKMTPTEERMKLAEELVSTEKTYIDNLQSLKAGFVLRLKESANLGRPILSQQEISSIFLNVEDILDLNLKFYKDLQKLSQNGQLLSPELGNTLKSYAPFFRLYIQYVNHYDEANRSVLTLREKNKDFDFYVKLNEACEKQRIQDFLILPVQRVPRYLLLLRGILKLTDQTEVLHAAVSAALNDLEKVANEINTSLHDREARQRVIEVQNHLEGCTIPLVTPTRYHCKDGALNKKYNNVGFKLGSFKKYWFFLFNDMLMYTTVPNMFGNCKLKYILPLENMNVVDIQDGTIPKISHAFELTGSVKSFTVHASSFQEKQSWITAISEQISILKTKMSTLKAASSSDPLFSGYGNDDDEDAQSESSSATMMPPSPSNSSALNQMGSAGYGGFGQGGAYATESNGGSGYTGMRFPIAGGGGPPPRPY